jgi:hypothetical protein
MICHLKAFSEFRSSRFASLEWTQYMLGEDDLECSSEDLDGW